MILFLLIVLGVVFLLIGISFVYQGYRGIPKADEIVPIEKFEKVQSDFQMAHKEVGTLRLQLDSLTKELEETKINLEKAKQAQEMVASLKTNEENYQVRIQQLEQELGIISEKAERQVEETNELIQKLTADNETLKRDTAAIPQTQELQNTLNQLSTENQFLKLQIEEKLKGIQHLESEMATTKEKFKQKALEASLAIEDLLKENESLKNFADSSLPKVQQLERDLGQVKEKNQTRASESALAIEDLIKRNRTLEEEINKQKSQITDSQTSQQLEEAAKTIEKLKSENQRLQTQLKEEISKITNLEEKMGPIQKKSQDFVLKADSQQTPVSLSTLGDELRSQMEAMRKTIETLKTENQSLLEAQKGLGQGGPGDSLGWQEKFDQVKKMNAYLLEKERFLQLELTRSRAQALGLEKICAGFQSQLEELSKKV